MCKYGRMVIYVVMALAGTNLFASVKTDPQLFSAWADQTFGEAFDHHRFSGLVVAMVKDSELVFSKGYGYQNYREGTPIMPNKTRFRIGSATKVFTATAIAQLLQSGQIKSLDDPVNRYLKRIQLPEAFGEPISFWHLLTHQAGFSDRAYGMAADEPVGVPLEAATIKAAMRDIVREPGTATVYSNFSTAVLGLAIEDISGQTVYDFFQQHIFTPLGMTDTALSIDISAPENLGVPYAFFPDGSVQEVPYVGIHPLIAPAGSIVTTAVDMAKFMIAHIDAGRTTPEPILSAEMFRLMHTSKAGNHPVVSAMGMKFFIQRWNGEKVIEHGGGWPGFQTVMIMLPDSGIGIFVSMMGGAPSVGLGEQLLSLVVDTRLNSNNRDGEESRFDPPLTLDDVRGWVLSYLLGDYRPPLVKKADEELSPYLGSYWRERRSYHSVEAILQLLNAGSSVIRVEQGSDHSLKINGVDGYLPMENNVFWKPRDPSLPRRIRAPEPLYAFKLSNGKADYMTPLLSYDVWRKTGFWNPRSAGQLLGVLFVVALLGLATPLWKADNRRETAAKWLPLLFLLCLILMPLVLLSGYPEGSNLGYPLLLGEPDRFVALILLANGAALIALVMVVLAVQGWRSGSWRAGRLALSKRFYYSALALSAALIIPCFWLFNLIGWHMP